MLVTHMILKMTMCPVPPPINLMGTPTLSLPSSHRAPHCPYHGPHISNFPLFSRRAWQSLWNKEARLEHRVGGTRGHTPNSDTHLQARGANHPHEASHSIITFLPKEAWGSPASLSPICSLGERIG